MGHRTVASSVALTCATGDTFLVIDNAAQLENLYLEIDAAAALTLTPYVKSGFVKPSNATGAFEAGAAISLTTTDKVFVLPTYFADFIVLKFANAGGSCACNVNWRLQSGDAPVKTS